MTVIVSTIWGGRISILVDRRISRRSTSHVDVLDDDSNKIVVVQCRGALFAIVYTGIAVVHESWTDSLIANLLAHRKLVSALAQPGSRLLARPAFALIDELKINLNGALNTDSRSRLEKLELLIQGWEYSKGRLIPFSCKLKRGAKCLNGNRYFYLEHHPVAKFFRENPTGIWGETLGDDGGAIDTALQNIVSSDGFTHDKVEQLIAKAICSRSLETQTVSPSSYALQLDPRISDSQVTFTFYPHKASTDGYPFFSPWVMTPRMFCSPTKVTSAFAPRSGCGDYLLGGFSDGHTLLNVVTRLPIDFGMPQGKGALSYGFQRRPRPP